MANLSIYLSKDELAKVQKRAEKAKQSVSEYVREQLDIDGKDLRARIEELERAVGKT